MLCEAIRHLIHSNGLSPSKLSSMIVVNPMVAMEFIREFLKSAQAQSCLDVILQSPLSVQILHVASQMMVLKDVSIDFFESFTERNYTRVLEVKDEQEQRHLLQCYCFYLSGVFKNHLGSEHVCMECNSEK